MAITERLALIIDADGKGAVRELEKVGQTAEREIGKAESSLDKVGKKMTSTGTVMMAGAAVVGAALWDAAGATSDLAEAADYSGRVFGEASGQITEFAESAEAIGLSERAAHEAATTFADLLKATGATSDELADMSVEMTELAADMASAKNTTPEEAIEALGAALRGESEPIRKYGVMLDEATLKQKALEMGLIETTSGTLPIAIKMQAAYAEILEQTAGMQGNFADTADSAANKQRVMTAQIENAKATIGEGFLPVMSSMIGMLSSAADKFGALNDASGGMVGQVAGVGTVVVGLGGALSFGAGKAIEMRQNLEALRTSSSNLGQFIGKNVGTLGALGAALGVATMVWDDYQSRQAKAAQETATMVDLLDKQTLALGENAEATLLADFQTKNQADDLNRAGVAMSEVTAAIEDHSGMSSKNIQLLIEQGISREELVKKLRAEGGARNELVAKLYEEGEANKGLMNTLYGKFNAYDAATLQQAEANDLSERSVAITEKLGGAITGAGAAAITAAGDQAGLKTEYADTQEELDKLIDDTLKYWDAVDGVLDPQIQWEAALDNMTQTLGENGTQWDWIGNKMTMATAEGRENIEAFRAQRDAALAFGQAELAVSKDTDKATAATMVYVEQLKKQWRQAGLTEEQVGIMLETVGLTPEQIHMGWSSTGLDEQIAKSAELAWQIGTIPRIIALSFQSNLQSAGSFIGNAIAGKASGGPIDAGVPYLVGEKGPELIVPGQSGTVIPAGQTASLMAGGGAAPTPVVNVYIGNEQVQAKVEHGLLANKRSRTGWTGVGS